MAVLVGLQTTPLNLSRSLFPTSPSVLQSLCYKRKSSRTHELSRTLELTLSLWLLSSYSSTQELIVGVGVPPKVACGEPSRSHLSQPFRNASHGFVAGETSVAHSQCIAVGIATRYHGYNNASLRRCVAVATSGCWIAAAICVSGACHPPMSWSS
jgi:hypothetical protein